MKKYLELLRYRGFHKFSAESPALSTYIHIPLNQHATTTTTPPITMKFNNSIIALLTSALPAVLSLPTNLPGEPHPVSSCAAPLCLQSESTPGLFNSCNPSDLGCICSQPQSEVSRFVGIVEKCIDDKNLGGKACTAGGRYEYKSLLVKVCKESYGKTVAWTTEA